VTLTSRQSEECPTTHYKPIGVLLPSEVAFSKFSKELPEIELQKMF
jgi:hypothetical protein